MAMERKEQKDFMEVNKSNLSGDSKESSEIKEYYVNIDGEEVKVDVKSDEEYSCLLNCLEGYYVYGIGRDDDCDEKSGESDNDNKYNPTQQAWVKAGFEHAKSIHECLVEESGREITREELEDDSSIKETGEIVYSGTATIERRHFKSDEEYQNLYNDMDNSECLEFFDMGVQRYINEKFSF